MDERALHALRIVNSIRVGKSVVAQLSPDKSEVRRDPQRSLEFKTDHRTVGATGQEEKNASSRHLYPTSGSLL